MQRELSFLLGMVMSFFVGTAVVRAQESEEAQEAPEAPAAEAAPKLKLTFTQGEVKLPGGKVALNVPDSFKFLSASQARRVLTDLWDNPPDSGVLGMLLPAELDPAKPNCWAVVITYEEDGHVSDADAEKIDYDELLKTMQKDALAGNRAREKAGYPTVKLLDWAARPRYDKEKKHLFWAKLLQFGDDEDHTLNYNIRILGRKGVLVLNAVADEGDLAAVQKATTEILSFVAFTPGNRYEDFDPSKDKTAEYGLAALIAGGGLAVAAKTGLLKGLWLFILGAKKLVILVVIAVGAIAAKVIARIRRTNKETA